MSSEFINPIVQATYDVLEEVLGTDISRRRLSKHTKALPLHRISALAGLTGTVEGYIVLSMPLNVALSVAAVVSNEEVTALDDISQAAIIGLVDTIMLEALRRLREEGAKAAVTPTALFWGQGLQLSCSEIEAALIPLQMPLGSIELTVALQDSRDED
ncbi:MAG: hypothetical protein JSV89_05880 [Spirochaetaceae bacterium]|nr:MAG: hypothetical protein JSV89_05880 [Spirochaetaceae bacterium]